MKFKQNAFKVVAPLFISIFCSTVPAFADWTHMQEQIDSSLQKLQLGQHKFTLSYSDGALTIDGEVASQEDKNLVEETVRRVDGITRVEDRLVVTGVGNQPVTGGLARDIEEAIHRAAGLGTYSVQVVHVGDKISLTGTALNEKDRERIGQIAQGVASGHSITNELTLATAPGDAALVARVHEALSREKDIDLAGVSISANSGIVVIKGAKNNHREIDRILSVALMVEGVRDIKSEMKISR